MDAATIILRAQRLAGRVDGGFDERSLEFVSEGVERWALSIPWPTLRFVTTIVADGTRNLVAPDYFRTIRWLADETNQRAIEAKDYWDREFPGQYLSNATGSAFAWREEGIDPVYRQPSALGALTFRSTTSDVYTAHISGISRDTTQSGTAGYEFFREETVNIAGSGPVSSANAYIKVLTVGRNKKSAYDLTISEGSTQLGRLGAGRHTAEYRRCELITIPPAGTNIRVGGIVNPAPITNAAHVPHPSINREYLVWYTAALIHKAQGQFEQGELCQAKAKEILSDRLLQERQAGDRDYGLIPDQAYWNHEELRSWP